MPRAHDLHVIPDPTRGGASTRGRSRRSLGTRWNVWRAGRCLSSHRTQKTAVAAGRRVARQARVDLVTYGRDGRVRSKDSYGNETAVPDKEH
jgi:hypothetical protein